MDATSTIVEAGLDYFEPLIGQVSKITLDLSGPFLSSRRGKWFSQISVEATLEASKHELTMRYHVCLYSERMHDAHPRLSLRSAQLDDELDGGAWPIEWVSPRYHAEYKDRFTANACVTALILKDDESFINKLKSVLPVTACLSVKHLLPYPR